MNYATRTHHCEGCECRFDTLAYNHHFAHDHCEIRDGIPVALLVCNMLHEPCPMNHPDTRQLTGGWTSKQRRCDPQYVLRGGYTLDDNGHRYPTTWLTIGRVEPPPARPNAPRPPAALRARHYHPNA